VGRPDLVGTPYLGRHFVCTTSGTTGVPGLFVHDRRAVAVYRALVARADLTGLNRPSAWPALASRRFRWASVVGTGGHPAGQGWMESVRGASRWRRRCVRVLSAQQPLPALVSELNAFDPAVLLGYPNVLAILADEQDAGRLRLRPLVVEAAGESMPEPARARVAASFGAALHEAYAASEFLLMATDCRHGWLHVNSDWAVLEPVEADGSPTPAGRVSHSVLLTNLVNGVQPLIRYELGDSVMARPDPCPCGSPLPAVRVQGRRDDVLVLHTSRGDLVKVAPLAIVAVVDQGPGVRRSQIVQTGPRSLLVRLETRPGADPRQVRAGVAQALTRNLAHQGLAGIELTFAPDAPRAERSGKFRQVVRLADDPEDRGGHRP
jgi:phenylacetate-coenzyme A ligase PaaK-like adenylate-forming protein